jgi:hypothetical protein
MWRIIVKHNDQLVSNHAFKHFAGACHHLARLWDGDAYQAITDAERDGVAVRVHESTVVPGARTVYTVKFREETL